MRCPAAGIAGITSQIALDWLASSWNAYPQQWQSAAVQDLNYQCNSWLLSSLTIAWLLSAAAQSSCPGHKALHLPWRPHSPERATHWYLESAITNLAAAAAAQQRGLGHQTSAAPLSQRKGDRPAPGDGHSKLGARSHAQHAHLQQRLDHARDEALVLVPMPQLPCPACTPDEC